MESLDTWGLILRLQEICQDTEGLDFVSVHMNSSGFDISANQRLEDEDMLIVLNGAAQAGHDGKAVLHCSEPFSVSFVKQSYFDRDTEQFLKSYLPYALLPYFSNRQNKVFVIAHLAQTLDGKIASVSGDSRWIGNQENLIHAHRMRALCDAVLVGASTNKIDRPRLTVRHVEGQDPLKVVVGSCRESTLLKDSEKIFIDTSDFPMINGQKDVSPILKTLQQKGVSSVYLEGGATTSSTFLRQGGVDQLQIHFSSKVLGSGKQGLHFEGIESIGECIQFKNPRFVPVGDEMMFLGEL